MGLFAISKTFKKKEKSGERDRKKKGIDLAYPERKHSPPKL